MSLPEILGMVGERAQFRSPMTHLRWNVVPDKTITLDRERCGYSKLSLEEYKSEKLRVWLK